MRLVILDAAFGDCTLEAESAARYGVEVEDATGRDLFAETGAGADGVLVRYSQIGDELMQRCPTWRVIGRYGVGVDNIDLEAATRRGIAVINVPDYCIEEVATHTLALVLACWRRLPHAARLIEAGRWNDWHELQPIGPLSASTLGLVGVGRIGAEVVRMAAPLFGRIVAYDPAPVDLPARVERIELDVLFREADVVSLHCPLTADTRHIANAERLAAMHRDSLLVNVSRGELVDTAALADALAAGRPGRAALDVLPEEPPSADDRLLRAPNLTLTNHVAWYSTEALPRLRREVAARCAAYLTGEPVATIVNL